MNEGTDEEKEELKQALSNARKQSPIPTLAGQLGTNVALYGVGSKAMQAIPAISNLTGKMGNAVGKKAGEVANLGGQYLFDKGAISAGSKILGANIGKGIANSTANILGDTILDVALDTVPATIENVKSGMSVGEVAKEAGKNIGTNLAFNVGGEAVGNILPALKNIDTRKKVDDIIDTASEAGNSIKENASINVEKATVIQSPYKGEVRTQAKDNFARIDITRESLNDARMNIETANIDSKLNGRNSKKILTKVYETLFGESGEAINVPVEGLTFGNKAYNVTVNKNAVGKILSDKNFSAEKLAILDNIDNIIENSKYVGSGDYVNYKNSNKNVSRYDYFETMCKIDGEDYVVSFDVEVVPGSNNYRTHKVINEINLSKANQLSTDMGPAPTVSVDSRKGLFNNSISNTQKNVNSKSKTTAPKGKLILYPAILRKFILFTFSLKFFKLSTLAGGTYSFLKNV